MQHLFLTILLLCSVLVWGQDYRSLIAKAGQCHEKGNYKQAVAAYKEAFKTQVSLKYGDLYDAACSAALAGDKKTAFQWLNLAIENGWQYFHHLKKDNDLATLHRDRKWRALMRQIDQKEANYDKTLQTTLLTILDSDQGVRQELVEIRDKYGYKTPQMDSIARIVLYTDSLNLIQIKKILDKDGWVGPEIVGKEANNAIFAVIQHSDLASQQQYLPLMREATKNNKADKSQLALLEDRVALREGRRQIYGTQTIRLDDGKNYLQPLEDPDNVDKRRAAIGLGPIAEYLSRSNIVWDLESYKKQLPEIEQKIWGGAK